MLVERHKEGFIEGAPHPAALVADSKGPDATAFNAQSRSALRRHADLGR
tara:strand:+ start:1032 stop:1178 length:147 start_codon:yes stop_codon:yes gene_type:complete